MKLLPGDHVAQKDLTDEQYHAIAKKFMEAGAERGEYRERRDWSEVTYFGWNPEYGLFHGNDTFTANEKARTLTPSQILEDDVWSGEGMPKIGTEVEVWYDDGRVCWNRAYVVGHHRKHSVIAASLIGDHQDKLIWANTFRPIKSDRDKAIEAACKVLISCSETDIRIVEAAKALFDAGLLKLPEGEQ